MSRTPAPDRGPQDHAAPTPAALPLASAEMLPPFDADLDGMDDDVLAEFVGDLADDRSRDDDRDAALRDALRQWGRRTFGTVDAFFVEVHARSGYTVGHVRNALTYPKGGKVLDAAVELYRERTGSPSPRAVAA